MSLPYLCPRSVLATAPLVALAYLSSACTSHPLAAPLPKPGQNSRIEVNLNPSRKLDMIFMIDNSASMKPKQDKLAKQFPRLIDALKDPAMNPALPDMRIAIINSDVGTGRSGSCSPQYGDRGRFQMRDTTCGANPGARWLEFDANGKGNFAGELPAVFGCLAKAVGVGGCGFEQPLQALNLALNLKDEATGRTQSADFLRPDALLAIVLLTDEDDCSMPLESLLAQTNLSATESWSLRCATRAHQCQAKNLSYPTSAEFSANFDDCQARTDTCPDGESGKDATSCSPLADVKKLAESIKAAKGDAERILVASIFGWMREGQTGATYRIAKAPQPGSPTEVFDYWPVCEDPNFPSTGGYNETAWGMGAQGGLRIKAFLDEFPDRAQAFSICEPDFTRAMSSIGAAIAIQLGKPCLPRKLQDTDLTLPGLQPDCDVRLRSNGTLSEKLPYCSDLEGRKPCWKVVKDEQRCPAVTSTEGNLFPSQYVAVERQGSSPPPADQFLEMNCLTCADLLKAYQDGYQIEGCK